jgi:hypothetical protein
VGLGAEQDGISRHEVEAYIERQVDKEKFAVQRFAELMATFTLTNDNVGLSQPNGSYRGWYPCP